MSLSEFSELYTLHSRQLTHYNITTGVVEYALTFQGHRTKVTDS